MTSVHENSQISLEALEDAIKVLNKLAELVKNKSDDGIDFLEVCL